jgi:UDPglucose--hexose-1-phosphate uridylyltransferase
VTRVSGARIDPLTGEVVRITAARQERPNRPADSCPFCPGGQEAPEPFDVLAFPNRWPPLPDGRSEVVLYSPDHEATLASLPVDHVARLVDLWAERTEALGQRPDVAYVLVFENRGAEVGATIDHPHGQIYAFDDVPPVPRHELEHGDAATALGPDAPGTRLVARSGEWRAWVPEAAAWPYALVLAPDRPVPDLAVLDSASRRGLAALLVDVAGRLDRLFDAPMPYLFWFHQRPTDGRAWPQAWLHAHVAPQRRAPGTMRFIASGELGSGVLFNPVDPEDAAQALREV